MSTDFGWEQARLLLKEAKEQLEGDADQEDEEPVEARIEVEIPRMTPDLGHGLFYAKLPNFLSLETRFWSSVVYTPWLPVCVVGAAGATDVCCWCNRCFRCVLQVCVVGAAGVCCRYSRCYRCVLYMQQVL